MKSESEGQVRDNSAYVDPVPGAGERPGSGGAARERTPDVRRRDGADPEEDQLGCGTGCLSGAWGFHTTCITEVWNYGSGAREESGRETET